MGKVKKFVLMICLLPKILFCMQGESSFPYLSGYTWAHFCDWQMLGNDYGSGPENIEPENIQLGDTIFLDLSRADEFATEILPKIKDKIILISANYGWCADHPAPGPFAYLLNEEKVAAWFVQNIDRESSEKLIPIPIGIASRHWPHGNTDLLNQRIPSSLAKNSRSILCYINYSPRKARADCTAHFLKLGVQFYQTKPFPEFLNDLAKSVFVISPPGDGLDCHRTWEALLMGCYPVVKSNSLDPLYEGLPVVVIQDWGEVTEEFLKRKYVELSQQTWSRDKLYAPYWLNQVKELQNKIRNL